jgi:hypothetical protein
MIDSPVPQFNIGTPRRGKSEDPPTYPFGLGGGLVRGPRASRANRSRSRGGTPMETEEVQDPGASRPVAKAKARGRTAPPPMVVDGPDVVPVPQAKTRGRSVDGPDVIPYPRAKAKARGKSVEGPEVVPVPKATRARAKSVDAPEVIPPPKAKAKARGKSVDAPDVIPMPKAKAKAKARGRSVEQVPQVPQAPQAPQAPPAPQASKRKASLQLTPVIKPRAKSEARSLGPPDLPDLPDLIPQVTKPRKRANNTQTPAATAAAIGKDPEPVITTKPTAKPRVKRVPSAAPQGNRKPVVLKVPIAPVNLVAGLPGAKARKGRNKTPLVAEIEKLKA